MRVDFTNADVTDAKHAVGRPVKASATSFYLKAIPTTDNVKP